MPATYTDRLQGLTTSVAVKAPCRVATIDPIWLSGLQTIDGVAVAAGDRVLVRDQSIASENGIWVAGSGNWERALDFDGTRDAVGGTIVPVNEGAAYAGSTWRVVGDGPVTPGISSITFHLDILASDLTGQFGAALIGSLGGKTVQYFIDVLAGDALMPEAYGAAGNGIYTTAERTAMEACRADALALGKPILLTRHYNVGTGFYPLGAVTYIGQGDDPRIMGAVLLDPAGLSLGQPINIDYDNGSITRRDVLASSYKRPFPDKSLWLGPGDQGSSESVIIDTATVLLSINDFPGSDIWTTGAYGFRGPTGIGFTPDTDNRWYAATAPVHGGMELAGSIGGVDLNRGVVVVCTSGTFGFYAADFNAGNWYYKPTGGAVQTGSVAWEGVTTHDSWIGKNVLWTIRFYDSQTIGILLNGTEVYRYILPSGRIIHGGFMLMRTTAGATGAVEWMTARKISRPQGGRRVKLAIYGDSKSAPYFGAWSDSFREALDGASGVRVEAIVNRAENGDNSNDQLAVMTANPPAGMTDCVIHVGTNDIQTGATPPVTVDKIGQMITIAAAQGCRVYLVVPDLWYTQALAGGTGEPTSNYAGGAATRSAIMHLAALRGCAIIPLHQAFGPVLGSQVVTPDGSDFRIRDNIHPTAFTYRLVGMEIARSVLREAAHEMKRAIPQSPLPIPLQNGWTAGSAAPAYSVSEDGICKLSGIATPGTKTDGTVVLTLPRNLWPTADVYLPAWIGGSSFCLVSIIASNGNVEITGAGAGTYLSLDSLSFRTISLFG